MTALAVEDRVTQALRTAAYAEPVAVCDSTGGRSPEVVADDLGERRPDVVVLGPNLPVDDALRVAERLDRDHPEVTMILRAEPAPELLERALEAGIRRVLPLDATLAEALAAVEAALDRAHRRRAQAPARPVATATAGTAAPRVITVLSPKGGSGKTTVATNLAAGLARAHPGQVVIVDLDLQFGDVADAFLLDPTHTLCDLPPGPRPDPAATKLALTRVDDTLFALCGADDPASGEQVPITALGAALDALAGDFPYVVVDTGAGIDAAALAAIERSTDLVLVSSLDVPSIRSIRKLLLVLDQLGLRGAERHVVLNRAGSDVGIDGDDVASTLGLPIAVQVPSCRAVPTSLNEGRPLVTATPTSPAARPLLELVARFSDAVPVAATRRGLLRGWRR